MAIGIVELFELGRFIGPVNTRNGAGVDGVLDQLHVSLLAVYGSLGIVGKGEDVIGVLHTGSAGNALPLIDHEGMPFGLGPCRLVVDGSPVRIPFTVMLDGAVGGRGCCTTGCLDLSRWINRVSSRDAGGNPAQGAVRWCGAGVRRCCPGLWWLGLGRGGLLGRYLRAILSPTQCPSYNPLQHR